MIFRALSCQLAALTTATPSLLKYSTTADNGFADKILELHVFWLCEFYEQFKVNMATPWPAAYGVFYAAVFLKHLSQVRPVEWSERLRILGESSNPIAVFDAANSTLTSVSRDFRGLEQLSKLARSLLSEQQAQARPEIVR